MSARLIQITDCHLFADPNAELKGICTRKRLEAVVAALHSQRSTTDRLIVTGDLTHDDRIESYRALRELFVDWLPILRVIPGNHDDRAAMRDVFGDRMEHVGDRNVFLDEIGGWKLIGLDSQRTGFSQGQLGPPQLEWLESLLATDADSPTALFLHHPPVGTGSAWLDRIGLDDASELQTLLKRQPQIRLVATGHIHQELTTVVGRTPILTTPATGVQFLPASETLVVDSAFPGYRMVELMSNGSFRTRVVRVPVP